MLLSDIVWTPDIRRDYMRATLMNRDGKELWVSCYLLDHYDCTYDRRIKHLDLDAITMQALLYHYDAVFVMYPGNNFVAETTV